VPGEERVPFDLAGYIDRVRSAPCFICRIVSGVHDRETHIVHRDQRHIVFLPNFHVLRGYALVAPTEHREAVAADFTEGEYLDLQRLVRRVALALERTVATERVYVLSLGSAQGNAHVHWHVVALPSGVPYEDQQFRSLMAEVAGVLDLSRDDQAALAQSLSAALASDGGS
jgi:histidine triad (HIT) family protein/ATP adenylyltransferase